MCKIPWKNMFDVVHFASDLFKQVLFGPRLCIPDEKNA